MTETKNKELEAMEADVKKAVGKEKEDLVAKTIAETKERLAKEAELEDMKAKLEEQAKAAEEAEKKRQEEMAAMEARFKEEQEKLVQEFKDTRKSTVNTDNPFNKESNSNESQSMVEKYKNDSEFSKQVDEESRRKFEEEFGVKLFK